MPCSSNKNGIHNMLLCCVCIHVCSLLLFFFFSAGIEDYVSLTNGSITFSGLSDDLPAIQLRLRDDRVPEQTEQLLLHVIIPPVLEYRLVLETSTATVVILDDDGEMSATHHKEQNTYIPLHTLPI